MWKPIYDPGPWQFFLKRRDNLGVPLMEVRRKYLEEQLLFENYVSYLQTLNTLSPSTGVGGTPTFGGDVEDSKYEPPDGGDRDTGSNDTGSQNTLPESGPNTNELSGSGLIGSSSYFTNSRTLFAYYPPS